MRFRYRRLCRGFRELDGLSAAQAEKLIDSVRCELGSAVTHVPWVISVCVAAGCFVMMFLLAVRVELFGIPEESMSFAALLGVVLATLLGPLAGFMVRDVMLRQGLRRRIDEARCRACGYHLTGLTVRNSALKCPECGANVSAAECLGVELRARPTRPSKAGGES